MARHSFTPRALLPLVSLAFLLLFSIAFAQGTVEGSGTKGVLMIGESVTRGVASGGEDDTGWHTYMVPVPAGQTEITITVTSNDDIDFAYRFGTSMEVWSDDADGFENTFEHGGTFTIQDPLVGPLYVDVLNFYPDRSIHYTLSVTGPAALPTKEWQPPLPPRSGLPQDSGEFGTIPMNEGVTYTMAPASADFVTWHSFDVNVPAGLSELSIYVVANDDLDFAYRFGAPIDAYDEVDYLDSSLDYGGSVTIPFPAAGPLHIDVINWYEDVASAYTLLVTGR